MHILVIDRRARKGRRPRLPGHDGDDLDVLVVVLSAAGYRRQSAEGSTDGNFVMVDGIGGQVDIHVVHLDTGGRHVYGDAYPRESLQLNRFIAGEKVQCITTRSMYQFETAAKERKLTSGSLGLLSSCANGHLGDQRLCGPPYGGGDQIDDRVGVLVGADGPFLAAR